MDDTSNQSEKPNPPVQLSEIAQLDIDIGALDARLKRNKKSRLLFTIFVALLMIGLGVTAEFNKKTLFFSPDNIPSTGQVAVATIVAAASVSLYFYIVTSISASSRERDYEQLISRRRVLESLAPNKIGIQRYNESYFEKLVQINVTNLADYYTLVKVHTDNSFKVSIVSGSIGFLLIALGVFVGFINNSSTQAISYISTSAGVITEFISGVFFFLYNRTVRQLKDYHDSLIAVQNILLSFKIVGDLKDEKDKVAMVSSMIKFLIGGKPCSSDK